MTKVLEKDRSRVNRSGRGDEVSVAFMFVISSCSFDLLPWGSKRKTTKLRACMLFVFTEAKKSAKTE